jgi:hypothetical protein
MLASAGTNKQDLHRAAAAECGRSGGSRQDINRRLRRERALRHHDLVGRQLAHRELRPREVIIQRPQRERARQTRLVRHGDNHLRVEVAHHLVEVRHAQRLHSDRQEKHVDFADLLPLARQQRRVRLPQRAKLDAVELHRERRVRHALPVRVLLRGHAVKRDAIRAIQAHRHHAAENEWIAEKLVRRARVLALMRHQHEIGRQMRREWVVHRLRAKRINRATDAERRRQVDKAVPVPMDDHAARHAHRRRARVHRLRPGRGDRRGRDGIRRSGRLGRGRA